MGRGIRLISTAGCVLMRHMAEKQRKEHRQEDKRFVSSAQAAKQCTLPITEGTVLHVQSRWKFFPVPGQQHTSPQQLQQKATCYRTGSSQCYIFELNKFHNGNYHVTVQPKNLSMSAKGSAVDWWQSVCPWNRPSSEQFDKENSKYPSYFCSKREE